MPNRSDNARKKLKQRIASYERVPISRREGYKRPGSQNAKKQLGDSDSTRRR